MSADNKAPKKSRRKSREFALQGLYQWRLTGYPAETIRAQLKEEQVEFALIDGEFFWQLLRGSIAHAVELEALFEPLLDRKAAELSPVEYALLLLGTYELQHLPDVPYRVVINEAVELAKSYGGTDGHKYVNGILDKLAAQVRAVEVAAKQAAPRRKGAE
ncbi:MAG: transcription antitermination factor NusB [Sulfuricellaceae bacterium]|nr:transcription antitermination factor NusB [Sulfuricellaceae bacterium]